VQEELTDSILHLAPPGLGQNTRVSTWNNPHSYQFITLFTCPYLDYRIVTLRTQELASCVSFSPLMVFISPPLVSSCIWCETFVTHITCSIQNQQHV
jgi:hypothetical protein